MQEYLLCTSCEARFKNNGEDWIIVNSYRGRGGGFALREILLQQTPYQTDGNRKLYSCIDVPGVDIEKIIYFAASVFWRASARMWRRDERTIKIDLAQYQEPLRLFLLGMSPFPDRMALHTWISSLDGDLLASLHSPEANRVQGVRAYQFAVPGITFRLMVGGHIPQAFLDYCTAPSPLRVVGIIPDLDHNDVTDMAARYRRVAPLRH